MATLTGNDGSVIIDSTTLAAVRNWSVDVTSDTIEFTTMKDSSRQYVKGMSSYTGSADIYFDSTEFAADNVFNPTNGTVGTAGVAAKLYLDEDAANDVLIFANSIIVTGYSVTSSMDGMVEASISFQGNGAIGYSNTGSN